MSFHLFFKRIFFNVDHFLKSLLNLLQYCFCCFCFGFWFFNSPDPAPWSEDWSLISCSSRGSLNRWTTREVPKFPFKLLFCWLLFAFCIEGPTKVLWWGKNTRKMTYPDDTDGRTGRRGPFNVAFGSFSKIVDSGLYPVPFRVTVMVGRQLPQQRPGWGPLSTLFSALCLE